MRINQINNNCYIKKCSLKNPAFKKIVFDKPENYSTDEINAIAESSELRELAKMLEAEKHDLYVQEMFKDSLGFWHYYKIDDDNEIGIDFSARAQRGEFFAPVYSLFTIPRKGGIWEIKGMEKDSVQYLFKRFKENQLERAESLKKSVAEHRARKEALSKIDEFNNSLNVSEKNAEPEAIVATASETIEPEPDTQKQPKKSFWSRIFC